MKYLLDTVYSVLNGISAQGLKWSHTARTAKWPPTNKQKITKLVSKLTMKKYLPDHLSLGWALVTPGSESAHGKLSSESLVIVVMAVMSACANKASILAVNLIERDCVEVWPRQCSSNSYWSTKWKRLSSAHLLLFSHQLSAMRRVCMKCVKPALVKVSLQVVSAQLLVALFRCQQWSKETTIIHHCKV